MIIYAVKSYYEYSDGTAEHGSYLNKNTALKAMKEIVSDYAKQKGYDIQIFSNLKNKCYKVHERTYYIEEIEVNEE